MRYFFGGVLLLSILSFSLFLPPAIFPVSEPIVIEPGLSNHEIAGVLAKNHVVKNATLFALYARLSGSATHLQAGTYLFDQALPVWALAERLSRGEYGTTVRKVTIPEGSTNAEASALLDVTLGDADQGYLFPDTYYFDQFASAEDIRRTMKENFISRVGSTTSPELIIMASVLEGEVKTDEDRRTVAGILYKRLEKGMLLQVDVATSTYQTLGLPEKPLNNPGLEAIDAARSPKTSPYLYYISDKEGVIHYAKTFEEHKRNREKYGV